jgi:hypothetical protein
MSNTGRTTRQAEQLREKKPCPSCAQNYKNYQKKLQAIEEKARLYEEKVFELVVQIQGLTEKNQWLLEHSRDLSDQVHNMPQKPSLLRQQLDQVYIPQPE